RDWSSDVCSSDLGDGRVGVDVAQRSDDVADGQITVVPESFHDLPFQCTELDRSKLLGRLVLGAHEADTTWRGAVGSGHETWPRSRQTTAITDNTSAIPARYGCSGANRVSVPVYPTAISSILLHTWQPTANHGRLPAVPPIRALRRPEGSRRSPARPAPKIYGEPGSSCVPVGPSEGDEGCTYVATS